MPLTRSYNRQYTLFVGTRGEGTSIINGVEITGLQIEFRVELDEKSETKDAEIKIYNLSKDTISLLSQENGYAELSVGYGESDVNNVTIISGDILVADTYQEGSEVITEIFMQDGFKELMQTLHPATEQETICLSLLYQSLCAVAWS